MGCLKLPHIFPPTIIFRTVEDFNGTEIPPAILLRDEGDLNDMENLCGFIHRMINF